MFLFLALRLAERTEDVFGPLLGKCGGPPLAFVFTGCALVTAFAVSGQRRIRLKRCPCSSSVVTRNFCGIL